MFILKIQFLFNLSHVLWKNIVDINGKFMKRSRCNLLWVFPTDGWKYHYFTVVMWWLAALCLPLSCLLDEKMSDSAEYLEPADLSYFILLIRAFKQLRVRLHAVLCLHYPISKISFTRLKSWFCFKFLNLNHNAKAWRIIWTKKNKKKKVEEMNASFNWLANKYILLTPTPQYCKLIFPLFHIQ